MGSGKTTHGKKLAALMGLKFADLDDYLERSENRTVKAIFDTDGESVFRNLERKYLEALIHTKEKSVIALGGGAICFNNNVDLVKKNGILLYIELPAAAIYKRLENAPQQRPILSGLVGEQLLHAIELKLAERESYYKQAHITINGLNLTAQQIYSKLIAYTQENNR